MFSAPGRKIITEKAPETSHQDCAGPRAGRRDRRFVQRFFRRPVVAGLCFRQHHVPGRADLSAHAVHDRGADRVHLHCAGRGRHRRHENPGASRWPHLRLFRAFHVNRGDHRAHPRQYHPARRRPARRDPHGADGKIRRRRRGHGGERSTGLRCQHLREHRATQSRGGRGRHGHAGADFLCAGVRRCPYRDTGRTCPPGDPRTGGHRRRHHRHHQLGDETGTLRRVRADLRDHLAVRLGHPGAARNVRVRGAAPPSASRQGVLHSRRLSPAVRGGRGLARAGSPCGRNLDATGNRGSAA